MQLNVGDSVGQLYDNQTTGNWELVEDKIKCKHDNFGTVTEFDKFERK